MKKTIEIEIADDLVPETAFEVFGISSERYDEIKKEVISIIEEGHDRKSEDIKIISEKYGNTEFICAMCIYWRES